MKRIICLIICSVVFLAVSPKQARACSCDLNLSKTSLKKQVKKAQKHSQVVFSGRVLEISRQPESFFVKVKLKVEKSWKNDLLDEITIVTGIGDGDCGYRFQVGENYLVYAYGENKASFSTSICQRTAELSEAVEDLKILGKGKSPLK